MIAQRFQIADDDAEHVVEIVRDAAGEVSDHLHLLRLRKLPLDHVELSDILGSAQDSANDTIAIDDGAAFIAKYPYLATLLDEPSLDRLTHDAEPQIVAELAQHQFVFGMNIGCNGGRRGNKGLWWQAAQAVHLLRPDIALSLNVILPAADPCDFLREIKPFLAVAERGLGILQRSDVDAKAGDAAFAHAPFGDERPTPVPIPLFHIGIGAAMLFQTLREPGLLTTRRIGILADGKAVTQQILKLRPDNNTLGAPWV